MKTFSINASAKNPDTRILIFDYLDIISRRKWWLIVPVLISLIPAIFLYKYLPKSYISSTLILVEPQKVPSDYVKPAISGTMEDRLATIRQQILSRSLLHKIIDEFGLYKKEIKNLSSEEVLDSMRKQIDIKTVGSRNVDAFIISFEGSDPKTVMNVTNKLASLYIEENLKVRQDLIEGTTDFLEVELQRLKESLDKQEQKISDHKRKYMGSLPQQLDANLRSLDRYQMELQTISASLNLEEDKKSALEKRLEVARNIPVTGTELQTERGSNNPDYDNLERMKRTLESLQADYTDAYPDVIILKRKIKDVEDALARKDSADDKTKGKINPDIRALYGSAVQRQLFDTNKEIQSLRERQQSLGLKIQQLEKEVASTPLREQEVQGLLRDYDDTKRAYQSLLEKKLSAKLSENLEKRQKGEQFRIMDLANLPEKPSKPILAGVFGMCLAGGFGAGAGLIFLVEALDTSFKKPEEIEEELGLHVLAGIPTLNANNKKIKKLFSDQPENRPDSVIR